MSRAAGRSSQMTLNVRLRDDATFDNFLVLPATRTVVAALRALADGRGEWLTYLHGAGDCGRSHLLQAGCHAAGADALYLPLRVLREYDPAVVLEGVSERPLLCLDDIDAVIGERVWEEALFHLLNRCREGGSRLLISAAAPPRGLACELPDLQSRLTWGVVFGLPSVDDATRAAILRFRAERRGLVLSPEVAAYILARAERSLDGLLQLLATLDEASLQQRRKLSLKFVKQTLGW
jgi:DnaA family protein